jgi:hypothetical protein
MFLKIQRRPKKKQGTVAEEPIEETVSVSLGESAMGIWHGDCFLKQ